MTMFNPTTNMRIVRTRSIPTAPTERLVSDLKLLHNLFHTTTGLHAFDAPRRSLVDNGRKIIAIRNELQARDIQTDITCRICVTSR